MRWLARRGHRASIGMESFGGGDDAEVVEVGVVGVFGAVADGEDAEGGAGPDVAGALGAAGRAGEIDFGFFGTEVFGKAEGAGGFGVFVDADPAEVGGAAFAVAEMMAAGAEVDALAEFFPVLAVAAVEEGGAFFAVDGDAEVDGFAVGIFRGPEIGAAALVGLADDETWLAFVDAHAEPEIHPGIVEEVETGGFMGVFGVEGDACFDGEGFAGDALLHDAGERAEGG